MIFPLLNFIINFNNSQINVNFFSLLNYLNLFSLKKLLITIFFIFILKEILVIISTKIKLKFQIEIITDLTQVISKKILLNLNKIKLESTLRILDGEIKFCYKFIESMFFGFYYFLLVIIFICSSLYLEKDFTLAFFAYISLINIFILFIFNIKSKKIGVNRFNLKRVLNKFILKFFNKKIKRLMNNENFISNKISNISKNYYTKAFKLVFYKQFQRSLNLILSATFLIFYFFKIQINIDLVAYIPILVIIVKASEYFTQVQNRFSSMTYQSQTFLKIEKMMRQFK